MKNIAKILKFYAAKCNKCDEHYCCKQLRIFYKYIKHMNIIKTNDQAVLKLHYVRVFKNFLIGPH